MTAGPVGAEGRGALHHAHSRGTGRRDRTGGVGQHTAPFADLGQVSEFGQVTDDAALHLHHEQRGVPRIRQLRKIDRHFLSLSGLALAWVDLTWACPPTKRALVWAGDGPYISGTEPAHRAL